jgi:Ca-activated chloride channel homolog
MTERDLRTLKDLPVPLPRSEARARALAAAMAAFDAAGENSTRDAQGSATPDRLTNAHTNPSRSWPRSSWMRSKHSYAIAASLAVVAIALPATIYHVRQGSESKPPVAAPALIAKIAEPAARAQTADLQALTAKKAEADSRIAATAAQAVARAAPAARPDATAVASDPNQSAWVKLCEKSGGTDICLTHHERLDGNTGLTIVSAALLEIVGQRERVLLVMVPLGVDMASGVEVAFDGETETYKLPLKACQPGGCMAEADATPALIAKLQQGKAMTVLARNGVGIAIKLPVPLNGFAWALANAPVDVQLYGRARAELMPQVMQRQMAILEKASADSKKSTVVASNSMPPQNWNARLGQLRADSAKPAEPKPADAGQTFRFGASTKFGDEKDAGQTGTRQIQTVTIDKDGRVKGGTSVPPALALSSPTPPAASAPSAAIAAAPASEQAPTVPGLVVAAAPTAAPEAKAPPKRVATVLFPKEKRAYSEAGAVSATDPAARPLDPRADKQQGKLNESTEPHVMSHSRFRLSMTPSPPHDHAPPRVEESRDRFAAAEPSPFKSITIEPVSTFSVDVDTAAYALVRRSLNAGRLPPREAVRIEEMINYFPYAYPTPESANAPFQPAITVFPAPWNTENRLVHVALKGYALNAAERPRANLVLLIDVSGSMGPADRLPLLKSGFRMLVENLKADDSVAIVTYANNTRVALEPTKASDKNRILQVIDSLVAGGGTYGEGGLQRAYALAEANFDKQAVNRVILATDGDFNIGIADHTQLKTYIEGKRQTGIFLSVLGVGMGNHNDRLMQALAQNGNGVAAYIDTLSEARKVLIEEASSSLFPIAKDVKIQIEFNPARVAEYRLLGYETRALKREDFNNDKVDAGDVGSGHSVTAIYEVVPVGAKSRTVDTLRYVEADRARREPAASSAKDGEYGFFKLRYKLPAEETSKLLEVPIGPASERSSLFEATNDVRFAVAVAAFGQLLQGSAALGGFGWDQAIELAQSARGDDPFGYRAEMINLMRLAKSLPR